MEQKYELNVKKEETIESLKEELIGQKNTLEKRIKRLDEQTNRDKLLNSLRKIHEVSESLIPMQEALNLVWKRTQQIEEEIKELIGELS